MPRRHCACCAGSGGSTPADGVLDRIAVGLGADVPVCLRSRPMRMRGVGEILAPAPALPRMRAGSGQSGRAAGDRVGVSGARRRLLSEARRCPMRGRTPRTMAAGLSGLTNDLEAPAISLAPAIGDVLRAIAATRGCLLARMSGSGATCFGLFADARRRPRLRRQTRAARLVELGRVAGGVSDVRQVFRLYAQRVPTYHRTGLARVLLGRRQVVRQRILIPSFGGSSPPAPAMDIAH